MERIKHTESYVLLPLVGLNTTAVRAIDLLGVGGLDKEIATDRALFEISHIYEVSGMICKCQQHEWLKKIVQKKARQSNIDYRARTSLIEC